MSSLENFCTKAIRFLFYFLFFFVPIVMWTRSSEVFEFNKMLFVYINTILIGSFWLIKSVASKKFSIAKTPIDIPILLFLTSQIISTLLSIDPHTSIWGYYSRFHGGLASTISYIILFYAFITHFGSEKKALNTIIWMIISSSSLVAIYGVLEHFGIDKHVWVQDVQSRVFSTLGQPNWLSAFLLAILPVAVISFFNTQNKLYKYLYSGISLLLFITILYTKSRSGIGATFIVLAILYVYTLINSFRNKSTNSKITIFASILLILITLFLVGTPWTPTPQSIKTASIYGGPAWPTAEKYLNKLNLTSQFKPVQVDLLTPVDKENYERREQGLRVGGSDSMEIRSIVWQGAVELAKKYPFFGTGVDTFGYSYYWVRPIAHNMLSEWDFLYNRAHNEYLNFAATTGFIGLFTYLLMVTSFLYIFLKAHKNNNPLAFPAFLGFTSILITNYFGFSVVTVALLFFFFPAYIISSSSLFSIVTKPVKLNFSLSVFTISALSIYLISGVYKLWVADLEYANAKASLLYGPSYLSTAMVSLEKAVKINNKEPLYKSILAEAQSQAAMYINEELKTLPASTAAEVKTQYINARDQYANAAKTNSQVAIDMNPYQTNYYKTKAKVGLYLSTFDPSSYNDVINSLLKVSEKAPTDAKVIYNIGLVYSNMNKIEEAKQAFAKAIELKPDYYEAISRLQLLTSTPSAQIKK